jgi:hypothetical protein
VDTRAVAAWLDGYSQAWGTYDPEEIGALFSTDAVYFYDPFSEPLRGREAIVADWLRDRDDAGTYEGSYRPVLVAGDQAVARGATAATSTPTAPSATSTTTCSCSASTPTAAAPSTASGTCASPRRRAAEGRGCKAAATGPAILSPERGRSRGSPL